MTEAEKIRAALEWIVQFMGEHPEWTAEHFTEHGKARPETEWLQSARALLNWPEE